ncbi:UDP-N-acetylmuramoyl-L-alanyl-D-glutamate--2,6-diaminopimelate ligase [Alteromonas sp. KUL49]|uniref:UDP-N-acetylmuramoyl-L-alanyl-D-glutamate--2, 6-diaminopimelate ligase n=1 Tax=Alteromonas sp. KUL49 TaxID=2480798 RepID=UPI00102EEC72|nr:UDP-N-acetylmuramoyl-L-alanyl-D-glutamate--2,6-diaminopimelate ligase [Alteromonas sp. KUL49]TAP41588.1 UDP-N-acetylmuramoyl-L-alanyl-D-glutamate--2,6-diaminopimelate ligase [Alteromonas sp. KUL49]GEA10685.1 UDP-N-acetylmuramoyl-L-alanyl-D-glutamate--2,6-diaminopimelate ligase [Alteromonas sp. KUL49]
MVVSAFVQSVRSLLVKFDIAAPDIRVQGLTLDSRQVNTKLIFVAIKGHERDGRDFIPQAISLGARAVFSHTEDFASHGKIEMRGNTVIVHMYDLPAMLSSLAAAFYDYPASKMTTVAVTGTNGKTSTVQMVTQLKALLGSRCGSIGTLGTGIYDGKKIQWTGDALNTTPDAISMQYTLAEFAQSQVTHVAFEASSHALVQGRLSQVKTDVAVFTNLTRDHLDYHGTMEAYGEAKRKLLLQPGLKAVVLNANDSESLNWDKHTPSSLTRVWTGMNIDSSFHEQHKGTQDRHCFATNVTYHPSGCEFDLVTSWGQFLISLPLMGEFSIRNVLSAVAVLLAQNERIEDIASVLPSISPVAGRMEIFAMQNKANVLVDYAHTPDALIALLKSVRKHTNGNVWCIFGCGGDRDQGKRPLMGEAAERGADHIVITNDNSRSEAPDVIAQHIKTGLTHPESAFFEPDREQAIRYCLNNADKNDLIVVAGKGHEDYQIIGEQRTNYNERKLVAALQEEYSI